MEAGEVAAPGGSHTEPDAVVMARHVPIVEHVSQRRLIWLSPVSDPATLMAGIRRLGVRYVILGDTGADNLYYRPGNYECFAPLLRAFPESFRVSFRDERAAIYQVRDAAELGASRPRR